MDHSKGNFYQAWNFAGVCVCHSIGVLRYRKVCARWVPFMLMVELQASRVGVFQKLLSHCQNKNEEFLHSIITADKTQLHYCAPETKGQLMEYHHKGSPLKRKTEQTLV
jgi:hypothetical protein